ncbi:MAG: nucleoside hydrolase, partial [Chloroflexi bacterium]|nr:nucleoside hydrolase [Chloroflexota bacterium]
EGISIVAGNVPVEMGSRNARYTAELCGVEVPVYEGALKPLLREPYWAFFFHGPDGMGGMNYPEPARAAQATPAVEAIIETFRANPGEIDLVTLGPLTNLALAISLAPDLAAKIPVCYVMGGAANTVGNITAAAEYNIWFDPEAARMVFHSGIPLVMVGWELCRGVANLSDADMQAIRAFNTPRAHFAIDCNRQAIETNRTWLGDPALPLPDPITMAVALNPAVLKRHSRHFVDVETVSELTRGMTVVDERGVSQKPANVDVCWEIDVDLWKETLYQTLR